MYLSPGENIRPRWWSISSGQTFDKLTTRCSTIHSHFCDVAIKLIVEIVTKWLANSTADQDGHVPLNAITTMNGCPAWDTSCFLDATIISNKVACITICYASWRIHILHAKDWTNFFRFQSEYKLYNIIYVTLRQVSTLVLQARVLWPVLITDSLMTQISLRPVKTHSWAHKLIPAFRCYFKRLEKPPWFWSVFGEFSGDNININSSVDIGCTDSCCE